MRYSGVKVNSHVCVIYCSVSTADISLKMGICMVALLSLDQNPIDFAFALQIKFVSQSPTLALS